MIEGSVESVSPDGIVTGWVRDRARNGPNPVRVLLRNEPVAQAMAGLFRADLLRAGHGHGHYGFAARLTCKLPPGPCSLTLHLPHSGLAAPMAVTVPELSLRGAASVSVESLLEEPPGWGAEDVLFGLDALDPSGNYRLMGAPRYVDAVFRFALDRWPSAPEARLHQDNLQRGRISPGDLLRDVLSSRELADRNGALPSPFSPAFPFTLATQPDI